MFGNRLRKALHNKDTELSLYKQLHQGIQAQMIMLAIDPTRRIVEVNDNFARFVGHAADQLIGRPLSDFVPS